MNREYYVSKFSTEKQDIEKSNIIWNKRAHEFFKMQPSKEEDPLISYFKKHADIKNKTVLDIGCGAGRHLITLLKAGALAEGLEPSPEMINYCKQNLEKQGFDSKKIPIYNTLLQDFETDKQYDYLFLSFSPAASYYENYEKMLKIAKEGIVIGSWIKRKDSFFSKICSDLGVEREVFGSKNAFNIYNLLLADGYFPSIEMVIGESKVRDEITALFTRYSHWIYGANYTDEDLNRVKSAILKYANSKDYIETEKLHIRSLMYVPMRKY